MDIPSLLGWAAPRPAPDDALAAVKVGSELIAGQWKPLQAMRGQLLGEGGSRLRARAAAAASSSAMGVVARDGDVEPRGRDRGW